METSREENDHGRRGLRKAAVATARKLAVLMLTLWKSETDYQWTQKATV